MPSATTHRGKYSFKQLEGLWIGAGGDPNVASTAAAIALAESEQGNPHAHNPSGASGLWQILGQVSPGNIYNPQVNATNAVKKYKEAGNSFSPWQTYTEGTYKQYLPAGESLATGIFSKNPALRQATQELQRAIKRGETVKAKILKEKVDELVKGAVGESPQQELETTVSNLNPLEAISSFFSALSHTQTWIRILEVIAGAVLLYIGLKNVSGADPVGKVGKLGIKSPLGVKGGGAAPIFGAG